MSTARSAAASRAIFQREVRLAVLLALSAPVVATSQSLPYESPQRFMYGPRVGQEEMPAGATLEPRLDGAIQYANNVNLSSTNSEDALGLELAPGIYASYKSERFVGAIDYSLIGRLWDDGSLDDVTHALESNGRWVALRDLLFFDAQASYTDAVIDIANGANYGDLGIFQGSNLAEQAYVSAGPTLQKRFKDFLFDATYNHGRVWYLDEGKGAPTSTFGQLATEDSVDQSADVGFGLIPDSSKFSGRIFYTWARSDFEIAPRYEFERAGFSGGYELTRTLSAVGDVGKESALDVDSSAGGLDSDFWDAGLKWVPNDRSRVETRYGDRFFGESFSVEASHKSKLVEFSASYVEEPDVDTRRRSLGEFDPGNLPPWLDPNVVNSALNAAPYIGKTGTVAVTSRGRLTFLTLTAFTSDRDYLQEFVGDEEGQGVRFLGSRELASNLSVDLQASYTDYDKGATFIGTVEAFPQTHDYDTQFTLRGNRDFAANLIGSLEAGYFNRAGSSVYDGWWIGLRGRWFPDFSK